MTRTLPWLTSTTETSKIHRDSTSHISKRQRLTRPTLDNDAHLPQPQLAERRGKSILRKGELDRPRLIHMASVLMLILDRTPSTSPPLIQPPEESPLRTGLSADDIYIMVEDEFLATAQTFTRHLHQAEYKRLKQAVKERNTSTITSISRATDGTTRMREELKKKKEADSVTHKARSGVNELLEDAAQLQGRGDQESESESDFDVSDMKDDQIWQGTQLQSFMRKGPKQTLKSLAGIHGLKSHTRAAAGFRKATIDVIRTGDGEVDENEEEVDTDDLDAPSYKRLRSPTAPVLAQPNRIWLPPSPHPIAPEDHLSSYSHSNRSKRFGGCKSTLTSSDIMSHKVDRCTARTAADVRARLKVRSEKEIEEKAKEERDVSRAKVEEMPLF